MRRLLPAALLLTALALAGCSAPAEEAEPSQAPAPAPSAALEDSGSATLEEAASAAGCDGLRPTILSDDKPPVVASGTCKVGDGELSYLWEFADHDTAMGWLDSGALEIGATDAVFVDGAVVLLATDAATAQVFGAEAEPYTP